MERLAFRIGNLLLMIRPNHNLLQGQVIIECPLILDITLTIGTQGCRFHDRKRHHLSLLMI